MEISVISDSFILGFVAGILLASVCWYYAIKSKIDKQQNQTGKK